MRRSLTVGSVLVLLSVGLAGSAAARNPGPNGVPAVQATVKDQCTGRSVPGFVASLTDSLGASVSPSKVTASGFSFVTLPSDPVLTLHVSAPGYAPLNDPANPGPDPGVGISPPPGPPHSTEGTAVITPTGDIIAETLAVAIMLAPSPPGGCAQPRMPSVPALKGKVFNAQTGLAATGLTVNLVPDPRSVTATDPGPATINNNTFVYPTLTDGTYNGTIESSGIFYFFRHTEGQHRIVPSTNGNTRLGIVLRIWGQPAIDQPPDIDWLTASDYGTTVGNPVLLASDADDPDPPDNASLTYQWSASGPPTCNFTSPTAASTTVSCSNPGTTHITLTVTDPQSMTATKSFFLTIGT
jgi:hypothetical protein